jgi:hypothetical protein
MIIGAYLTVRVLSIANIVAILETNVTNKFEWCRMVCMGMSGGVGGVDVSSSSSGSALAARVQVGASVWPQAASAQVPQPQAAQTQAA